MRLSTTSGKVISAIVVLAVALVVLYEFLPLICCAFLGPAAVVVLGLLLPVIGNLLDDLASYL
jgi:hypothetical protein